MARNPYAKLNKMLTTKQINELREDLIKKHGNQCAICQKPRSHFKKNLALDHNHLSGKIRGLLCFRDNKFFVGRFTVDKACLLLTYLIRYDEPKKHAVVLQALIKEISERLK